MTDNTQLVADLKAARALIAAPGGWTQGAFARVSPNGRIIGLKTANAACFCALGALCCVKGWDKPRMGGEINALIEALPRVRKGSPDDGAVGRYNDDPARTQAEVVALYDRAIATAEAAP